MDCRILEIQAADGKITAAKYHCSLAGVETEGWWYFKEPADKPFAEIQESDVVGWIVAEAGDMIRANLERQVAYLSQPKAVAPWLPQVFTPSV